MQIVYLFGLPWNFILWFFFIRPRRHQFFSGVEEALGIMIYSIYGIVLNLILVGVICLLA